MLPLGQIYTMNIVKEAAEAAIETEAPVAIPIHFEMYEGSRQDAEKYRELKKVEVIIK